MSGPEYLDIDGSVLEGGGQILRLAAVFSALYRKPVRVFNIRAGRSNPGLRPQHVCGLQLVRDLCGGTLTGDQVGSMEIKFSPGVIKGGKFVADTGTAGNIPLLIQVSLPCMLFAKESSTLLLKGGTNTSFAPQIDYMLEVFKPVVERFGVKFDCEIRRRGFYPKGGGEVVLAAAPLTKLNGFQILERGPVKEIRGTAWSAGALRLKVAQAVASASQVLLNQMFFGVPIQVHAQYVPNGIAVGSEMFVVLKAMTQNGCILGADAVAGKQRIDGKRFGSDAATALAKELQDLNCVDSHLQDQLIVFMTTADGHSQVNTGPLTMHTKTAIHVAELMTKAKFTVEEQRNGTNVISCTGDNAALYSQ